MKIETVIFVIFLLLAGVTDMDAQVSVAGKPESFRLTTKNAKIIPEKLLIVIDTAQLAARDKALGIDNRYGVMSAMTIDIKKDGVKTEILGKGYIWQVKVTSIQSYSLGIHFSQFQLPTGATLFLYDESHQLLAGAFTKLNNNDLQQLMVAEFPGQQVILEYFEPYDPEFSGTLYINSVSQSYVDIIKATAARIEINCPEGANWQDVKHSVCRMTFNDAIYSYYCTGFLVNNIRNDGTPYFQTANHCISTAAQASTLITYFNYENSTCTSSDASIAQTLSGATLKATSNYTDFTLLLLNEVPPQSYTPFFAGWDATIRIPLNGTCIHHPAGTPKCISLGYNPPSIYNQSIQWTDANNKVISTTVANTHWLQVFDVGQTEGGSSGSPLFDDKQRAVGQLHGGSATENYYGIFNLSWNYNAASSQQLKYWLDPDMTGNLIADGSYLHIAPKAAYTINNKHVCLSDNVIIDDNSKYYPNQWNWTITPNTYHFVSGTGNTTRNIAVVFETPGYYAVTLKSTNQYGSGSFTDTVHAEKLNFTFQNADNDSVVCGYSLINYPLNISGANTYVFTIQPPQKFTYTSDNNHLYLNLKQTEHKNGSFDSWVKATATLGSCVARDSLLLKVRMPANDDVANALRLKPGFNGSYSNFCGSAENNEPYPPLTGCFSNDSWCPDPSLPVLNHTIWFTFRAPSYGNTNIDTHGMNNRIAVYDADTSINILSTGSAKAVLMGANEGRSAADGTSYLGNLKLQAEKIYWLQVDGSNNTTGSCTIDFLSNSIEVYPNPSTGNFNLIIANNEDGLAEISAFTIQGAEILKTQLPVTRENNQFNLSLSAFPAGMYLLNVKLNGSKITTKLMVIK